jgi:hypothetical protein
VIGLALQEPFAQADIWRCLGSFFARMKFETMVNEVLARMPDYQMVEDEILPYTTRRCSERMDPRPVHLRPGPQGRCTHSIAKAQVPPTGEKEFHA